MPRTALLFPGQGAQAVGMGQSLGDEGRTLFAEASEVLGYDLLDVCLNGPADRLNATDVSQPAIYVASLAALRSVPVGELDVVATAGLSLGEYTALTFAGALDFADGLRVVQARGRAMQDAATASPGAMTAVIGCRDLAALDAMCATARAAGLVRVANFLCPGNTVVSGETAAVARVEQLAAGAGFTTVRLAVAGAFHTDLMKPADEKLAAALAGVTLKPARVPVWSNVDARPHTDPAEIAPLLVKQVLSPVRWEETVRGLLAEGVEQFYEVGPGRVLAGLLKRVQRSAACINVPA